MCYLLFGCDNVLQLPKDASDAIPAGYGRVAVTVTGAARTVFPAQAFEKIEYAFAKVIDGTAGAAAAQEPVEGYFTLETGDWQVTVTAYAKVADASPSATGTSETFTVGSTIETVTVQLAGNIAAEGKGTFSYHIEYPDGAEITVFSLENLLVTAPLIDLTPEAGTLDNSVITVSGTEENVPAGIYWLTVKLEKDGVTTGENEAVYIYNGLDSEYSVTFTEKNFYILTYVITGSGTEFTATKDGVTVGTEDQPFSTVIEAIRTDANGVEVTIQFGDNGGLLDIGAASANFNTSGWGLITLRGKITSSNLATISVGGSINSTADIANTGGINGTAISQSGFGTVTISGGTVSSNTGSAISNNNNQNTVTILGGTVSTESGMAINNAFIVNRTINISGGTVSATTGTAIYGSGTVNISGGTVSAASGYAVRPDGYNSTSIYISGDATVTSESANSTIQAYQVVISGGTVSNTGTGNAVYNASTYGQVTISGGTVSADTGYAVQNTDANVRLILSGSPAITGRIRPSAGGVSVITNGDAPFSPVQVYTLDFAAYANGAIAVTGGGSYPSNFELHEQTDWILRAASGNLVILDKDFTPVPDGTQYVITGSAPSSFSATKDGAAMGTTGAIQTVIDAIRNEAVVAEIGIQFGDGTNPLDIDTASAMFSGSWGIITFTGKITSINNNTAQGTVLVSDAVSINSTADIANTASSNANGRAVYFTSTGALTISDSTVSAATGIAVYSNAAGTITISDNAIVTSENVSAQGTIYNASGGTVEISGGTVENTGTGNNARTVTNQSTGVITVSGNGAVASNYLTIFNNSSGSITINGGTVSVTGASAYAVYNYGAGTITVSGLAVVTSANTDSSSGTIHNGSSGSITISGGTVENTSSGNAVFNQGSGAVTINGGAVSAAGRAVNNNGAGSITLGGDPAITGPIYRNNAGAALNLTAFAPSTGREYSLAYPSYATGIIAVTGGAEFIDNFILANTSWKLTAINGHLVVTSASSTAEPAPEGTVYTITGSGSSFNAARSGGGDVLSTASSIADVIDAIKNEAFMLEHLGIQFGAGEDPLSIGSSYVTLNGFWGVITLSGKITSTVGNNGTITTAGTVSIISTADIANTSSSNNAYAINHTGSGTVTISGGTVSAMGNYAVRNTGGGAITISGGTVSVTGAYVLAVYNSSGALTISGGTVSSENYNAVENYGTLMISGGTILGGTRAVVQGRTGTITLSGDPTITGTIELPGSYAIYLELSSFSPSADKVYTVGYQSSPNVNRRVVTDGASFIDNFMLDSTFTGLKLAVSGNNLVVANN